MARSLSVDLRERVIAVIDLAELRDLLAGRGVSVGIATLWRFFARRKITLKKSMS